MQFGESVQGYPLPVLNEREIRAGAGILFLLMLVAWLIVMMKGDFVLLKYFILFFWMDLAVRLLISPKYAPSLIIGRLIVSNQVPEYVGAPQKKFAWWIGLGLSSLMLIHVVLLNSYSEIAGISCLICLIFLFFETAFGICLGCKFYRLFHKKTAEYCPGEVCLRKDRQDIQRTSLRQVLVLVVFTAIIVSTVFVINEFITQEPAYLWDMLSENR